MDEQEPERQGHPDLAEAREQDTVHRSDEPERDRPADDCAEAEAREREAHDLRLVTEALEDEHR